MTIQDEKLFIVLMTMGVTFIATLGFVSLFNLIDTSQYCNQYYGYRILPPADLPKNSHIECTGDGILIYIPWYALDTNRTYSIEYGTNISSVQRNGTWMIREKENNENRNILVWCK
jgi:hypothetical protein